MRAVDVFHDLNGGRLKIAVWLEGCSQPVGGGVLEEIGDGHAWSVDEEFGGREVGVIEGGDPGEGLLASATFDLDGDQRGNCAGGRNRLPDMIYLHGP